MWEFHTYNELYHHGILGQKWGKKNGPPYPLAAGDHSASEKKAGWKKSLNVDNNGASFRHRLKNRVAPSVKEIKNYNGKLYFVSEVDMNGKTVNPRVPKNYFTENDYEDNYTPRVCFTPSVDQCLTALSRNIKGKTFIVYEPSEMPSRVFKPNTGAVPDSDVTGELWVKEPVKLREVGKAHVIGDDGKDGKRFEYGSNASAELYGWNYDYTPSSNSRDSALSEIRNGKNYTRNLDDFGKDDDHNVLFITGLSGSGKSTLAMKFKDDNKVHLDFYFEKGNSREDKKYQDKEFNDYMDSKGIKFRDIKRLDNKNPEKWKIVDQMSEAIIDFSKQQYKKGKRVIVEGVELADETMYQDKKFFNDKPLVIVETSAMKSVVRGNKRDGISMLNIPLVIRQLKSRKVWNKHLSDIKETGMPKAMRDSKIKNLSKQGLTYAEIAKKLGISESTVSSILN